MAASSERDKFLFRRIVGTSANGKLSTVNQSIGYSRARSLIFNCMHPDVGYTAKNIGLHSFRISGATEAARNGVSQRLVKVHGKWKTNAAEDLVCP